MSSVRTLSSYITQPICNFWIPKATSSFFGCLFHVKPSISRARILVANSSKLVTSWSYILTSNRTMDFATGFGFLAFAAGGGVGLAAGFAGASSSAKGSKSSSSFFFSYFFSSFFAFFPFLSLLFLALFFSAHCWILTGEKLLMKRYQ